MSTEIETYTMTPESVSVVYKGESYTIKAGDPNFEAARKAVFASDWAAIPPLVSKGIAIEKWSDGAFGFKGGVVHFGGEPLPADLSDKICGLVQEGAKGVTAFLNFWRRCMRNPSENSRQQLYRFVNKAGIPITKEGLIVAYKAVRKDYFDKHSGRVKYEIGKYVEMSRKDVMEDPNSPCGQGLHAGTKQYVGSTYNGDLWLIVLIDPADVVSVPHDADSGKMRTCRMLPVGHYGEDLPEHYLAGDVTRALQERSEDEDEVEEDDDFEDEDGLECEEEEGDDEEDAEEGAFEIEEDEDEASSEKVQTIMEALSEKDRHVATAKQQLTQKAKPIAPLSITNVKAMQVPATTGSEVITSARTGKTFKLADLHKMDAKELAEIPTDALRKYAHEYLAIVGASKMAGGREALAARIVAVRPSVLADKK